MADALSHLLTNLGYLQRRERNVLRALYGAVPGYVPLPGGHGGGTAPQTSAESPHPGIETGLDVRRVASPQQSSTSHTAVAPSMQSASSVSGKAVHPSLTAARPSMASTIKRAVATPSGGTAAASINNAGGFTHPLMRASGGTAASTAVRKPSSISQIPFVGTSSNQPTTVSNQPQTTSTNLPSAMTTLDTSSAPGTATEQTGTAASSGVGVDDSGMVAALNSAAQPSTSSFPWLLVGGGLLAVLLLRK